MRGENEVADRRMRRGGTHDDAPAARPPSTGGRAAMAWLLPLLALAALLLATACQPRLRGTDMGGRPAADFQLLDQFGRQVALSDFRGRPVVLTFLYTSCPDVCPLTAEKLRLAAAMLGQDAARVGWLAVSTDPARDTVEAAYRFSDVHGLLERWHFLVGDRAQLEAVWKAYYIGVVSEHEAGEHREALAPGLRVGHTDALFLIDKQGRIRSLLRSDFDHTALADDLRALLRE